MLVSFRETIIDGTNETESDRPSHIWCVRARRVGLLLFRSLGFFVFFEDPSATTSMTCIIFFYFGYYFNVVIHSHNWPQCWFSVYRYYEEICAKSLLIDGFDENEFWTNRFFICIHSGSVYWTHKCIMMRIGWYGWEFRLVFFFFVTPISNELLSVLLLLLLFHSVVQINFRFLLWEKFTIISLPIQIHLFYCYYFSVQCAQKRNNAANCNSLHIHELKKICKPIFCHICAPCMDERSSDAFR